MVAGMLAGATQLVQEALKLVPPGSVDEGRLLSQYSMYLYFQENDFERAQETYTKALAIAQREADAELELRTLGNAAAVDMYHYRYLESLEKGLRGLELARGVDNPQAELAVLFRAGYGLMVTGDLQRAKPHFERMLELAERLRDRFWLATAVLSSAQASIYEGDWGAARQLYQAQTSLDNRVLSGRMQLEFELGEFNQSDAHLQHLLHAMRLAAPGPLLEYMQPALGIPMAARVTGDTSLFEVAEVAADTILSAANSTLFVSRGARAGLGFLAVLREDSQAAAENYAFLESSRGTGMAGFSLVIDRLLGLLAQTMGNTDLAAEHYEDALVFCRNGGYRPELAWTCHDYAESLMQRNGPGGVAKASSLLEESQTISAALGMRPLLERVTSLIEQAGSRPAKRPSYPDGLTAREVEVLGLVASGWSNREIAAELVLSARTVERHITNIYGKIGARGRADAANYAQGHRLLDID